MYQHHMRKPFNVNAETIQREVNRLFDSFWKVTQNTQENGQLRTWRPTVDAWETEKAYTLHVELPGISREEVRLTFEENALTISGERAEVKKEENEEGPQVRIRERYRGAFSRTVTFRAKVDADHISASMENGVLTITLPKAETNIGRQIEIA